MTKPKRIERRFAKLVELGCVACLIEHGHYSRPDIHHLVSGSKRLGDDFTIPLCPWHHRGVVEDTNIDRRFLERRYGPSFAHNKKQFIERYGSEKELLLMVDTEIND